MKKFLPVLGVLLIGVTAASAAPVDCTDVEGRSTLNRLLPGGDLADGCIDQDKVYTNFSYEGATPASNVQFDFSFIPVGTLDIHSANFQGPWTSNFTLGYTVTITDPTRFFSEVQVDLTRSGTAGTPTVTQANTPPGAKDPLMAIVGSDDATTIPGTVQQLAVVITGTPNGGAIGQFTSTYTQGTMQGTIPEPSTYALLGAGLLAIGYLRRKHV